MDTETSREIEELKKAFYEAYNEYQNLEEHPELIQDTRALYALKRKLTVYSVLADRFGQGLFLDRDYLPFVSRIQPTNVSSISLIPKKAR